MLKYSVKGETRLEGVPAEGIEPTHPCEYWILSPARLPVPPRRLFERLKSYGDRPALASRHPSSLVILLPIDIGRLRLDRAIALSQLMRIAKHAHRLHFSSACRHIMENFIMPQFYRPLSSSA
jgi:hypothetical protein